MIQIHNILGKKRKFFTKNLITNYNISKKPLNIQDTSLDKEAMEEATIMGTMEHTTMDKEEATMTASKKNGTTPGKNTINE